MATTLRLLTLFVMTTICTLSTHAQNCGPMDRPTLKKMIGELGYEVRDLESTPGKEKYEVTISKQGFNVPMAYEISPSTNYIWITVFLGKAPAAGDTTNASLLHQNFIIQPCQFYVTDKGNLMMGLAIENRGVSNAILKRLSDMVSDKVVQTSTYWNK